MFIELKEDNLDQLVNEHDKVMVQYGAGWCGNCRIMKPKFKKLSTDNEEVLFVYVDAEKMPESRKLATVDNLPTFASFVNGNKLNQIQTNQVNSLQSLFDEITNN